MDTDSPLTIGIFFSWSSEIFQRSMVLTHSPRQKLLSNPPRNRLFEAFREWSMGKIVCGYEMERLLGPKRECFPPSSRATRINSNFPTRVPTIPLGEGGPRAKDHGFPPGDMSMIKPQVVSRAVNKGRPKLPASSPSLAGYFHLLLP